MCRCEQFDGWTASGGLSCLTPLVWRRRRRRVQGEEHDDDDENNYPASRSSESIVTEQQIVYLAASWPPASAANSLTVDSLLVIQPREEVELFDLMNLAKSAKMLFALLAIQLATSSSLWLISGSGQVKSSSGKNLSSCGATRAILEQFADRSHFLILLSHARGFHSGCLSVRLFERRCQKSISDQAAIFPSIFIWSRISKKICPTQ